MHKKFYPNSSFCAYFFFFAGGDNNGNEKETFDPSLQSRLDDLDDDINDKGLLNSTF